MIEKSRECVSEESGDWRYFWFEGRIGLGFLCGMIWNKPMLECAHTDVASINLIERKAAFARFELLIVICSFDGNGSSNCVLCSEYIGIQCIFRQSIFVIGFYCTVGTHCQWHFIIGGFPIFDLRIKHGLIQPVDL
jgi:hypothetical protein